MASKLNFSAQLSLYTKGFEKGIRSVRNQLKSLAGTFQSFAASMGAGLGLYQLVSQMSSVAKELNTAKATLKNVSDSMADYNKSMTLARNLAKQYSQDMVSLMGNLASFQGSAKGTGISLSTVNDIFESLTKASAYFNLSSQQTSQVLTAVGQMMSKGTVQAQELKLQLANVLPGAFSIMARAVGVTTSELDKLMSQGKLAAKDVLPKFADELNRMTAGKIDTTGLQLSINRLKNTFTQFVESANIDRMLGKGVSALDKSLNYVLRNFNTLKGLVISVMAAMSVNKVKDIGAAAIASLTNVSKHVKEIYNQIGGAISKTKLKELTKELGNERREYLKLSHLNGSNFRKYNETYLKNPNDPAIPGLLDELKKSDKALESNRGKIRVLKKEISELRHPWRNIFKSIFSISGVIQLIVAGLSAGAYFLADWIKKTKAIKNAVKEARKEQEAFEKSVSQGGVRAMAEQEALLRSQLDILKDRKVEDDKRAAAIKNINSILGLEADNAFTIKTAYEDIVKEADKWLKTQQKIAQVSSYMQGIADAQVKQEEARAKYEDAVIWGSDNSRYKIRGKVREFVTPSGQRYKEGDPALKSGMEGKWETRDATEEEYRERMLNAFQNEFFRTSSAYSKAQRYSRNVYGKTIQELEAEANAFGKAEENLRKKLEELTKNLGDDLTNSLTGGKGTPPPVDTDKNTVKAKIDDYVKSGEELSSQLKRGAISAEEYRKEMDDLAVRTYREIAAFSDMESQLKALPSKYGEIADEIGKRFGSINGIALIADELDKYRKSLVGLQNQLANNTMTEDEYNDELTRLKSETYKAVSSLVNFGDFLTGLPADIAKALKDELDSLGEAFRSEIEKGMKEAAKVTQETLKQLAEKPEVSSGPVTYSTDNDVMLGQKDVVDMDIKSIEDAISKLKNINGEDWSIDVNDAIESLSGQLDEAKKKAKTLDDAMAYNEAKKRLKELKNEIADTFISMPDRLTGLADGVKDIISAFNEDIDFEKYDKLMTKIKAIISLIQGIKGAVDTAMSIKTLFESFKKAKESTEILAATTQAIRTMTTATEAQATIDNIAAAASNKKALAASSEVGSTLAAAAASETKAGSSAKEAVAEAGSSAAKIPFVGWALAGVAIAGIAGALISMFAKFQTGGIVGGNSRSGDKTLIRANSGEMVMNGTQQKRLWNIIDGKTGVGGGGVSGDVRFVIRGAELEGVLNNYKKIKRG